MGGLEGALANTAEAVYDKLSDREKQAAPRIFLQLVRPGEDAANPRRATGPRGGNSRWSRVVVTLDAR
jgi:hypothetical protein